MALPSAFQERLRTMEDSRNQRLSLLQAEKELQTKKTHLLSAKLSNIRTLDQRCLTYEHQIAALNFKILSYKSEIEYLETKYNDLSHQFRVLKSEIDEMEENEKVKFRFYEIKIVEMKEFKERVEKRISELRQEVLVIRKAIDEHKYRLGDIQNNKEYMNNSEIAAAEAQKAQLLSAKENLDNTLASNYNLRAQLQKQLYTVLKSQVKTGTNC